jgi:hypothetical protein
VPDETGINGADELLFVEVVPFDQLISKVGYEQFPQYN